MSKEQSSTSGQDASLTGEVSFVEMVRAADERSSRDLMDAVDVEQGTTYVDAGDNVREAVLLQIEEWAGSGPGEIMKRLGALAGAALEALDGISARLGVGQRSRLIGVAAESDRHYYPVGLYTSMEAAERAALEDIRAKNDAVPAEVLEAWEAGRLSDALEAWEEAQPVGDQYVEYVFLDF